MTLVSATQLAAYPLCARSGGNEQSGRSWKNRRLPGDLRRVEWRPRPQDAQFLAHIAPLNLAKNVQKPLFIVQGQNDPRVPASEAEQMIQTIKQNNVPAWYLLAKDEGTASRKRRTKTSSFTRRCFSSKVSAEVDFPPPRVPSTGVCVFGGHGAIVLR